MQCKVCNKEIEYGKRYKSERFKSYYFCSQECYDKYCQDHKPQVKSTISEEKSKSYFRQLTDYIYAIAPDEQNWPYVTQQIKTLCQDYELTYKDMLDILQYAVECEHVLYNTDYGLWQYFPKYIEPYRIFLTEIQRNQEIADNLAEDEITYILPKKQQRRYFKERGRK